MSCTYQIGSFHFDMGFRVVYDNQEPESELVCAVRERKTERKIRLKVIKNIK